MDQEYKMKSLGNTGWDIILVEIQFNMDSMPIQFMLRCFV